MQGGACEYCRISGEFFFLPFQIEHIVAKQHHGTDDESNFAYACDRCNQFKGPNLSGMDQENGELARLFHPRNDNWDDHFLELTSGVIEGLTPVGRVTVDVLQMNVPVRVELRVADSLAQVRAESVASHLHLLGPENRFASRFDSRHNSIPAEYFRSVSV